MPASVKQRTVEPNVPELANARPVAHSHHSDTTNPPIKSCKVSRQSLPSKKIDGPEQLIVPLKEDSAALHSRIATLKDNQYNVTETQFRESVRRHPEIVLGILSQELIKLDIVSTQSDFFDWAEKFYASKSPLFTAFKPNWMPKPPNGFNWPTETYSQAHKARNVNIVQFLDDPSGWMALVRGKHVDLRTLRAVDPSAATAVANYTRDGRTLPAHLHLPKLKEQNDEALKTADETTIKDDPRLGKVLASRKRQGIPIPR